jgi:hypothetical protein
MRLTLTYQGSLPSKKRGVSPVKAGLRKEFHSQIREQIAPMLAGDESNVESEVDGFRFISPAHRSFRTAVELDVLLLTSQGELPLGDTDNRLKTLIDGLTRPQNSEQMQSFQEPEDGGPTYCLMDDDGLVNRLTIDSRHWFNPNVPSDQALVIVTATLVLGRNVDLSAPVGNMFLVL